MSVQKALRNEPIEMFDPARIQPRIQRAAKAFEQGDYQFASEILSELEAEGHMDPAMSPKGCWFRVSGGPNPSGPLRLRQF
jgi:serine/threonine-protein kinase